MLYIKKFIKKNVNIINSISTIKWQKKIPFTFPLIVVIKTGYLFKLYTGIINYKSF